MYGDEPDRWDAKLRGMERLRFAINVLTRIRVCTAEGRVDLSLKGPPPPPSAAQQPWFDHPERATREARVIFGHWSALGFVRRAGVIGLDSGCAWGGALTACDLDRERGPLTTPCAQYQRISAG
jgi:bis(5'-nucleosyl)-tetraphosphatase (symmetrical)